MTAVRLETPLATLAHERRWKLRYAEPDGTGCAELSPGVVVEVDKRAVAGWTIGIEVRVSAAPADIGALTTDFADRLLAAAEAIRGTSSADMMTVTPRANVRAGVARRHARAC